MTRDRRDQKESGPIAHPSPGLRAILDRIEGLIADLEQLAGGGGPEEELPASTWRDDDNLYIETELPVAAEMEADIDVCIVESRVFIRMAI